MTASSYPSYSLFLQACQKGLSVIYPLRSGVTDDPYAWKYGTRYPPSYWAYGRMYSLLTYQLALGLNPKSVLDVGAGGGGLAASLAAAGCQVTANDLRAELLEEHLKEFSSGRQVKVVGGNMFDLSPGELGTFDLVVSCEVIEHVAHPDELLAQLKRFLNPGGRIMLTTPNGSHFRNRLPTYRQIQDFTELEKNQFKPDADGHLFLFTPQELGDVAAELGLAIEQLYVWGTPVLTGHFGFRFLANSLLTGIAYQTELLAQRLPMFVRERACASLIAILRAA